MTNELNLVRQVIEHFDAVRGNLNGGYELVTALDALMKALGATNTRLAALEAAQPAPTPAPKVLYQGGGEVYELAAGGMGVVLPLVLPAVVEAALAASGRVHIIVTALPESEAQS